MIQNYEQKLYKHWFGPDNDFKNPSMYYSKQQLINFYKKYFYDDGGSYDGGDNINGSYEPHTKDKADDNGNSMPAVVTPTQNGKTDDASIHTNGNNKAVDVTVGVPTKFRLRLG